MADGPVTPEQSSGSKFGFGRLLKRAHQNPAAEQTPNLVEVGQENRLESKTEEVLTQLEKKNKELGSHLASEFGEGDSRFMVLMQPLFVVGDQYPVEGIGFGGGATDDYLVATTEGFRVIKVLLGDYKPDPNFPDHEAVLNRTESGNFAADLVRNLVIRGDKDLRWGEADATTGSGYHHEKRAYDTQYSLNFGKDHTLNFHTSVHDSSAYIDRPTQNVKELAKKITYQRGKADQLLGDGTYGLIHLVVDPDPSEVSEIMTTNLEAAKKVHEREQEQLRQQEELAKEAEARTPEPEPVPNTAAQRQEKQIQAADQVIKLLE